jgi:hypothetical protein
MRSALRSLFAARVPVRSHSHSISFGACPGSSPCVADGTGLYHLQRELDIRLDHARNGSCYLQGMATSSCTRMSDAAGRVCTDPKKKMYPLPRSEFNPPRWALNVPNMKPWLLVCLISGVKGSISFDITNCSSVVRKLLKSVFHPQHWARFFHQLYIPPMVVTPQGTCRDVHDSSHVGGITNSSGFWDVQMWQNRQNRLSLSALQDQEGVLCHQTKHNRGRGSASQAATV